MRALKSKHWIESLNLLISTYNSASFSNSTNFSGQFISENIKKSVNLGWLPMISNNPLKHVLLTWNFGWFQISWSHFPSTSSRSNDSFRLALANDTQLRTPHHSSSYSGVVFLNTGHLDALFKNGERKEKRSPRRRWAGGSRRLALTRVSGFFRRCYTTGFARRVFCSFGF